MYLDRALKTQNFDRRAIQLVHYLMGENLVTLEDKVLYMPSEKAVGKELRDRQGVSEEDIALVQRGIRDVKKVLGIL